MDNRIAVGDLVQVVRGFRHPCKCTDNAIRQLGQIFRVGKISMTNSHCAVCYTNFPIELNAWIEDKNSVLEMTRLKRIPPLSELEGERTEETLKEPA